MSKLTLTTAETREATTTTADVVQVRISDPVWIDEVGKRCTFRYEKGHVTGSVFTADWISYLISIDNVATKLHTPYGNYDYFIAVNPPAPTETVRSNLDRRLLQYLLDKGLVVGTIS